MENGAKAPEGKFSEGGDLEPYVEALEGLGWTGRAARRRVQEAVERLQKESRPLSGEEILWEAISCRRSAPGELTGGAAVI